VETKRYNDSETFVKDPFIVISRVGVKAQDYGTLNEDRNTSQQLIVDKSIRKELNIFLVMWKFFDDLFLTALVTQHYFPKFSSTQRVSSHWQVLTVRFPRRESSRLLKCSVIDSNSLCSDDFVDKVGS